MIEINLLPKEYQRKRFKVTLEKNTLYVIGSGVIVLILLAAFSLFFQVLPARSLDNKITELQQEARQYDSEIALINELLKKKDLIKSRMETIDVLDQDREAWVNVASDLSSRIPYYLWLTAFEQVIIAETEQTQQTQQVQQAGPLQVKIEGKTFSVNSLATFLVRLKKSSYFKNVQIISINLGLEKEVESYSFVINCSLLLTGKESIRADKNLIANNRAAGSEF